MCHRRTRWTRLNGAKPPHGRGRRRTDRGRKLSWVKAWRAGDLHARIKVAAVQPAKKFSQQFKSRASVRSVSVSCDDQAAPQPGVVAELCPLGSRLFSERA